MPPNSHVLGDHLSLFNECIVLTVSDSLQRHGLWPARLLCPWEFSRQEYFSGLPFHLPGELPDPGTEPASPVSLTLAGDSLLLEPPEKQPTHYRALMTLLTVVQISSVAQSCPTFCDPMDCSTPGLPVHHQLPELTQTHVH